MNARTIDITATVILVTITVIVPSDAFSVENDICCISFVIGGFLTFETVQKTQQFRFPLDV